MSKKKSTLPSDLLIAFILILFFGWLATGYFRSSNNPGIQITETSPQLASHDEKKKIPDPTETADDNTNLTEEQKIDIKVEKEAIEYISSLTEVKKQPIHTKNANHFISSDQEIVIHPLVNFDTKTKSSLLKRYAGSNQMLTIVREVETVTPYDYQQLQILSDGDPQKIITIMVNGSPVEMSIGAALEKFGKDYVYNILTKTLKYDHVNTNNLRAYLSEFGDRDIIKFAEGVHSSRTVKIADLISGEDGNKNDLYYIRSVTRNDKQGLWGMIQNGLTEKFAKGIALKEYSESEEKLTAYIPRLADEKGRNNESSFLGKLISKKTKQTYLYNYDKNLISNDPNFILPGQQIVLVKFAPKELVNIYRYFSDQ